MGASADRGIRLVRAHKRTASGVFAALVLHLACGQDETIFTAPVWQGRSGAASDRVDDMAMDSTPGNMATGAGGATPNLDPHTIGDASVVPATVDASVVPAAVDASVVPATVGSSEDSGASAVADGGGPLIPTSLPPLVSGLLGYPGINAFLGMPTLPALTLPGWDMANAFTALNFSNATFIVEGPGTGRMFVAERAGRIFAFENRSDVTEKTLVLDISTQTLGNGDRGLVGFAFHPEFGQPDSPNRSYIYLHYPHVDPELERPLPDSVLTHARLSRFTIDLDTLVVDPSSELVLIDQFDESPLHLGGALFFHPRDGYLYLTVGDEGMSCARSGNCGRIDKDLFSGVLRIDVDPNEDDDSHAIRRQPEAGVTGHYTIPNDNPFVGRENSLEEFYAVGVRSPHRMTHDATDDIIWLGDVGDNTREEIDIVTSGANFQWDASEGSLRRRAPPSNAVGVWTDPVLDLTRSEARSVVGGYVYRGQRFPELAGKYIFGDFIYNSLWALSYSWDGQRVEVLNNQRLATAVAGRRESLTSLGVDAEGELYMTSLGVNRIKTLTFREDATTNLPTRLSATGIFEDVAALRPGAGLLNYDVRSPLFSDRAEKQRWLALPSGTSITFAAEGPWGFPAGTVFVKHFEMVMDERAPAQRRRLETRVLVAASDGTYYGATYKWNSTGTDAELLFESQIEPIEIVQVDGTVRQQEYFYPSPADCLTCHNSNAGYVLGVRTAQLNRDMFYAPTGRSANQLWTWSELGLFEHELLEDEVRALPKLAALGDETRTEEDRVRSYWDSNCSMCHGVVPGMRANWDARYQTPLADQRVVLGPSVGREGALIVVPGDVEASLLVVRDRSTDPNVRMPPLGRTQADAQYIELLEHWIASLGATSVPSAL